MDTEQKKSQRAMAENIASILGLSSEEDINVLEGFTAKIIRDAWVEGFTAGQNTFIKTMEVVNSHFKPS